MREGHRSASLRGARRSGAPRIGALGAMVGLLASFLLLGGSCDPALRVVPVGTLFNEPMYVTAPAGDPRLFVVERGGTIRIIAEDGTVLPTPFLDISADVSTEGERGLLGMAFSRSYASDRLFYLYYIDTTGDSVLARFQSSATNPNVAGTGRVILLRVDQPAGSDHHKGGTIAFSPADGMLYWALGDGGSSENAQDPTTLLGKMLRLDVGGGAAAPYSIPPDNPFVGPDGVADEIWALGFRNPFRFSFDRQTGDLWIGDVGAASREEVDYEPANDPGGRNYGWDVQEGSLCRQAQPGLPCEDPQNPTRFTFPLYEYGHVDGACAITGGVLYRGSARTVVGSYLFADFCSNQIWALTPGGVRQLGAISGDVPNISAFGEDGFGEVYLVSFTGGQVYRLR